MPKKRSPSVRYDLFVPPYAPKEKESITRKNEIRYQLIVLTRDGSLDVPNSFPDLGAAMRYVQGYKYNHSWVVRLVGSLTDTQIDLLRWGENPNMEPRYVETYLRTLGLSIVYRGTPRNEHVSLIPSS